MGIVRKLYAVSPPWVASAGLQPENAAYPDPKRDTVGIGELQARKNQTQHKTLNPELKTAFHMCWTIASPTFEGFGSRRIACGFRILALASLQRSPGRPAVV